MGDFNFGISSNVVSAISPVDYKQNSISKSYFSNDSVTHNMPDELLVEKTTISSTGKQTDPPSSNGEIIVSNGDRNLDDFTSANVKNEDPELSINNQQEKQINEVTSTAGSGNSSTPLQLEFSDCATTASAPSFWSGITGDDNFNPGVSPLKNTLSFQNFPNVSNQIYNSSLGAQISLPQSLPPQRRAITGAHNFSQNRHQQPQSNMLKTFSNWNNSQNTSWSAPQTPNGLLPWNTVNLVNQKRTVPNINPVCTQKKTPPAIGQHSVVISPSKFRRSTSLPLGKQFPHSFGANHGFDMSSLDENRDGNIVFPFQDHQLTNNMQSNSMDALRFPVEQQLLDIMRTTNADNQDHFKGYMSYSTNNIQSMGNMQGSSVEFGSQKYNGSKKFPRGRSPFFTGIEDNHLLDDVQLDQIVTSFNSLHMSPNTSRSSESNERYSRKVFVGGLPPDIDEEEITASFRRFGPLVVDWPHKAESKSYFPPKGYAFLLFQDESSVQALIDASIQEDDKLYLCVSSPTIKDKPVQIRPWRLSDADFVLDASMPLDPRKTVFVGGVPRPLKAVELAMIMDRLYGGVCYAGIDTDPELKYPKGAGRVAFSNQQSYIAAISARFVQLQHGDIEKRVEVKPYVLDDQMCDECQGSRCGGKFAPFFCANVTCLQYYCEHCWATIHSRPGREFHKPLVKEGADRPRAVPFRWC
ncbi:cytoplasmic polyadenylation element-binding protein 2 isoform X2 [Parasteatoda tepidariorum]|uniref:cytoplasmic polyadenylation element-binding protein 2 isoform X2 n=1 Tax=Parasteatoda tepidariorum TaxID=114398 RepID=UPI00077FA03A|nr:cytoplasmic polyadenylation element-binding protein 2 isoform X2 [Parasteatoda tepidariorum]